MSVTLFEPALQRLLESEAGPVGQDLLRRAEEVRERADSKLAVIIEDPLIRPRAEFLIDSDAQGLRAIVGIRDEGRVSRYLAAKETREQVWLVPALREAFDA